MQNILRAFNPKPGSKVQKMALGHRSSLLTPTICMYAINKKQGMLSATYHIEKQELLLVKIWRVTDCFIDPLSPD